MNTADLVRKIYKIEDMEEQDRIVRVAVEFIDKWHWGTPRRKSDNSPFGDHPREVMSRMLDLWHVPIYTLEAAGGHDAIEEGHNRESLARKVYPEAMYLIDGLTDRVKKKARDRKPESDEIYFRLKTIYHKKFERYWLGEPGVRGGLKGDPYLIVIKLADSDHNLGTMQGFSEMRKIRFMDQARYYIRSFNAHREEMRKFFSQGPYGEEANRKMEEIDKWITRMNNIISEEYRECALKVYAS